MTDSNLPKILMLPIDRITDSYEPKEILFSSHYIDSIMAQGGLIVPTTLPIIDNMKLLSIIDGIILYFPENPNTHRFKIDFLQSLSMIVEYALKERVPLIAYSYAMYLLNLCFDGATPKKQISDDLKNIDFKLEIVTTNSIVGKALGEFQNFPNQSYIYCIGHSDLSNELKSVAVSNNNIVEVFEHNRLINQLVLTVSYYPSRGP